MEADAAGDMEGNARENPFDPLGTTDTVTVTFGIVIDIVIVGVGKRFEVGAALILGTVVLAIVELA